MSFLIHTDRGKNRLYIKLNRLNDDDFAKLISELPTHISVLEKDFTCLTDIRGVKAHITSIRSHMARQIQHLLIESGVGKVVRVVSKESLNYYDEMERASLKAGYYGSIELKHNKDVEGYHGTPVTSMEKAEAILDDYLTEIRADRSSTYLN